MEKILYSFCSQTSCADGWDLATSLIDVKGTLYGITVRGGEHCARENGCGTVFALNADSGTETVLYSFGWPRGHYPDGGLVDMDGALYGTTGGGGHSNYGTVFVLNSP